MPQRPCLECGELTPTGSRCSICDARHLHQRSKGWSPHRDRASQSKFRTAVLKRDGRQCRALLADGRRCPVAIDLRAHHLLPLSKGGNYSPANGLTLCKRHDKEADHHAR